MFSLKLTVTALTAALLLASCGGESGKTVSDVAVSGEINRLVVMGDSLSDSGTFAGLPVSTGYARVFSIQNDSDDQSDEANAINWAERINLSYGLPKLCNVYSFTGLTFVANPASGCTNSAVGGGRINLLASKGGTAVPVSIIKQINDASAKGFTANDLVAMDGGGNDAADIIGAYLAASNDGGASYQALLSSLLPTSTVGTLLSQGQGGAAKAGGAYMVALADLLADSIKTKILDKGAMRVVVLNLPGVTSTPRFQMVLKSVEIAKGKATRDQLESLFKTWLEAYNQELTAKLGGDSRVLIVDFYTEFNKQIANPSQYDISNVTTPACPPVGVDSSTGLPVYNFATCTVKSLSAQVNDATGQPANSANWWSHYAFSDSFHPTPYGYKLVGQLVSRSLAQAGWL